MSIVKIAFKQGLWLGIFKFFTQIFSWASTVIVARLLVPDDYGLMAMATILTGYAALFSEMGLGAAIVQRPSTSQQELSSVFWFVLGISLLFAAACFLLAYPTAYIFDETRVIPLTQAVSVIFIINGLQIVPFNLIKKRLEFKKVGFAEMVGSLVSCASMVGLAYLGAGVWTLLLGHIVRSFNKLIFAFYFSKWIPSFCFSFGQIKSFVGFGLIVTMGSTLNYVSEKSDKFFAGIAWPPKVLGYYSFALQLAQLPTEKIVSLINQVSFSVFSELQREKVAFNDFYLKVTKVTAMFILPLFFGGFLAGEELIKVLLGDKWIPIIFLFKILCLSQILLAITTINNHVHNAQGRPGWGMCYNAACALFMSISFYFAVKHGLNAMLIPWITTFPVLCIVFIIATLIKIKVGIFAYLKNLSTPVMATFVMCIFVILCTRAVWFLPDVYVNDWLVLGVKIASGVLSYLGFLFVFDRSFLQKIYNMLRKQQDSTLRA